MLLHTNTLRRIFLLLIITLPAYGHGANIFWEMQGDSIFVTATFDDGTPMDGAQVTVFSGAAPAVPYTSGIADENGKFAFLPDAELSLIWDVQARKAGHGDMIHFSLTEASEVTDAQIGFTTLQIIIMSASVVWGFIGTALFFSTKRKNK